MECGDVIADAAGALDAAARLAVEIEAGPRVRTGWWPENWQKSPSIYSRAPARGFLAPQKRFRKSDSGIYSMGD